MSLALPRTDNRRQSWPTGFILRAVLGGLCPLALWGVLYQADTTSPRLTDAQMMTILQTHCPALRQQPDVLGCLPDPTGIRLITDRPALMPTQVAGLPIVTEPPPPHLPPPPGIIVLRPEGPDPQPTLSHCPPGYTELQKYRWRFCNSPANPQPIPTSLMIPPIAGVPYTRAEAIFQRQDFIQLPGVQSVALEADGIVVQTTEPTLIPSSFEGLPVRTEEMTDVFRLANHTITKPPSLLRGGVAIGDGVAIGGHINVGTLGGFVWSGGEPWLVTAAHNFPSKCGNVPPCPVCTPSSSSCRALHECRDTATSERPGIPAKLAPRRTSPAPPTVSTLTRWTPLTHGVTTQVDVAAGPVNVDTHPINRSPEGFRTLVDSLKSFRSMVTGYDANPMMDEPFAVLSAPDKSHTNIGRTGATMRNETVTRFACGSIREVNYKDLFVIGTTDRVISQGTSGGLVINGDGRILGMHLLIHADPDLAFIGLAAKAKNIKTALKFEKWVGSETVPVQGNLVSVGRQNKGRPTLRGWAYDPLNPNASLKVEVYADGKRGAGTKVNWGTATDPIWTITADKAHTGMSGAEKISGKHGLQEWLPPQYSTSPFYLYALAPGDTTGFLLNDSPLTPTWPKGHQAINPRDGDPDENSKPQRIAISVTNDDKNYPPTNYPVHPNAKKAVEEVLKIVWDNNATPSITSININSTLRGPMPDSKKSPHISGRGLDINQINEKPVRCAHPDFATNTDCTALMKNKKSVAENMKTWVTALQDAFWADCRVTEVLGPVRNKTKYGAKPRAKTIRKHRDHIHITAHPITRSTPCPP